MNTRNAPGFGQWFLVTLLLAGAALILYKLYQFGQFQQFYPAGLEIGGINVGLMTQEEAEQSLTGRYLQAPVHIFHREQSIEINPAQVDFTLDFETMIAQADYQNSQQDFWSGFWGFLWNRPIDVDAVPLFATHDDIALANLVELIADQNDSPALPPQPIPGALSFQYGDVGIETDIEASLPNVEAALYRPRDRDAYLVVTAVDAAEPQIELLRRLLVNSVQLFEESKGGTLSIFIADLQTGQEINYNAGVPMTGIGILKIPIIIETLRTLRPSLTSSQQAALEQTAVESGNDATNALLTMIAGEDDAWLGADLVTESMRQLGLTNSFLMGPFDEPARFDKTTLETDANSTPNNRIEPHESYQVTAEDVGILLTMLYYCAEQDGGALRAAYRDTLLQSECEVAVELLQSNRIGSLIEEGVPPTVRVAHRHEWYSDTYADAGIVYSPAGDYVIVVMTHKPGFLAWEDSSQIIADVSRATYNYFNFDQPWEGSAVTN